MKKILGLVAVWFVALYTVSFFADALLPYDPSFPYADAVLATTNVPRWMYSWANFDGVHYLTIVKKGYVGTGLIQAFFPVYPGLLWIDSLAGIPSVISGQIISVASFVAILVLWPKLFAIDYGGKVSRISRLVLLLFPTSFFFMALYTESLFLLLVLLSFYFARQKQWWVAIACAALASGTRVVGIALLPALLVEYVDQRKLLSAKVIKKPMVVLETLSFTDFTKLITIMLSGSGLFAYMAYLWIEFGDPLYFFHVQEEFGGGRSESVVLLPQVFVRYIRILLTVDWKSWAYFAYMQEFVLTSLTLVALAWAWMKKFRPSYLVFASLVFIIPTLTGTFSSMPRYVLACFPLFIVIAQWLATRKNLRFAWYTISSILLILSTLLFIQGYWLA